MHDGAPLLSVPGGGRSRYLPLCVAIFNCSTVTVTLSHACVYLCVVDNQMGQVIVYSTTNPMQLASGSDLRLGSGIQL
jgi:hypothetical protein